MKKNILMLVIIGLSLLACKNSDSNQESKTTQEAAPKATISSTAFGQTTDGTAVEKYSLKNSQGMEVDVITYGGIITKWTAPDKNGNYENIVLGYDNVAQYEENNPYFGALIGRYGNRIAKGQFSLDGEAYQLPTNDGPNHLHGGDKGFDKVVWEVTEKTSNEEGASIQLKYVSADMEMGYPGTLTSLVTYTLTNDNSLEVDYAATTDKKTIVNLTQHSYFNLSGDFTETILDHEVQINASKYLPVDETLIPTGELADVEGTPFDFKSAKAIGDDIESDHEQIARGKGFDHCWAVDGQGMRTHATVFHPESGRMMEIVSNEPGIQFYTGNFLDGTLPMPGGGTYAYRTGFCLETQHYPDSPNQENFPSVVLEPGEKYSTQTSFKFTSK